MNKSAIVLVQRQTLEWGRMTEESFRSLSEDFCRLWGKPADYVYRLMQLWNRTFSLDYFTARQALKEISSRNIASASDIVHVPYRHYANIPDTDGFYLFMDDDDWIDPAIAVSFASIDPANHDALLWRSVNVGSPQQEYPVFVWGLNGRCMTNNYAISSVWMDHLARLGEVVQHAAAAASIARMQRVELCDIAVTASNKSPCSSVSLDRGLAGILEPARLASLVEAYIVKMEEVREEHIWMVPWIRPLLEETTTLFRAVLASRMR